MPDRSRRGVETRVMFLCGKASQTHRKFSREDLELAGRFIETVKLAIAERSSEDLSGHPATSGG